MWIDTHAHFDEFEEAGETEAVVDRARMAGVHRIIGVGGTPASNRAALLAAARFPQIVRAALGWDRSLAPHPPPMEELIPLVRKPEVTAIGEIGLDYYYGHEHKAAQLELLRNMLHLARETRLPVILHCREAEADLLSALGDHVRTLALPCPGILHCFTGNWDFARQLLDLGMMISFSGIVTFRNADALREVAARIPEGRLLIETDSPYLAPAPHRGRKNEPAFVVEVARRLADVRGVSLEEMAGITTGNAERFLASAGKDSQA